MSAAPEKNAARDRARTRAMRIGIPVAIVAIALVAGAVQGPAVTILVLAGGALVGVIATFWASIRTLAGETPLAAADAYALGAPRAEEEQKRAVIRALKDLEFEHSVGKISEEDFAELTGKYRAEAKRLLRHLDSEAQPRRLEVEALVTKRLRREGLIDAPEAAVDPWKVAVARDDAAEAPGAADVKKAKKRKKQPRPEPAPAPSEAIAQREAIAEEEEGESPTCAGCGTRNDADAVFCKKCGRRCGQARDDASSAPAQDAGAEANPKEGA